MSERVTDSEPGTRPVPRHATASADAPPTDAPRADERPSASGPDRPAHRRPHDSGPGAEVDGPDEGPGEGHDEGPDESADADGSPPAPKHWMDWWHHSHPTFAALTGFYAGMGYVILVPSIFGGLTRLILGADTAERVFPYVLLFLLVPLGLLVNRKTRRFAEFVWIGILVTAVVVLGVAALTLWVLVSRDT